LAVILWALSLIYFCLTPSPPQLEGPLGWDKLQHAGAFGLLAYFIFKTSRLQNFSLNFSGCFAVISTSFFGGLIELLQGWLTPNRNADLLDFMADTIGSMIVVFLLYIQAKAKD